MPNKKQVRKRGKIMFSRRFQNLKNGDSVSVVREFSVKSSFPKRLQGRSGVVLEKRGQAYIVEIKDNKKVKKFIIGPVHLRKIIKNIGK